MVKIALCQTEVFENKQENLENAYRKISRAAYNGAKIVALGEMFNCPYDPKMFKNYAEEGEGETLQMLRKVSREWQIYLVGGTIPEYSDGKIYNTSYVLNPEGNVIDKYRKIHLFDVDIKGQVEIKESETISPGYKISVVDTEYGKLGVCICYDIRFPELIRKMTINGAQMIFVPAAFNTTTGPAHWSTLFKSRAMDNQLYMFGISSARNPNSTYKVYGHSIAVDPWGDIIAEAQEFEDIIYANMDIEYENRIREQMPFLNHRRGDIY